MKVNFSHLAKLRIYEISFKMIGKDVFNKKNRKRLIELTEPAMQEVVKNSTSNPLIMYDETGFTYTPSKPIEKIMFTNLRANKFTKTYANYIQYISDELGNSINVDKLVIPITNEIKQTYDRYMDYPLEFKPQSLDKFEFENSINYSCGVMMTDNSNKFVKLNQE